MIYYECLKGNRILISLGEFEEVISILEWKVVTGDEKLKKKKFGGVKRHLIIGLTVIGKINVQENKC